MGGALLLSAPENQQSLLAGPAGAMGPSSLLFQSVLSLVADGSEKGKESAIKAIKTELRPQWKDAQAEAKRLRGLNANVGPELKRAWRGLFTKAGLDYTAVLASLRGRGNR